MRPQSCGLRKRHQRSDQGRENDGDRDQPAIAAGRLDFLADELVEVRDLWAGFGQGSGELDDEE
jgi:hypothetical protein